MGNMSNMFKLKRKMVLKHNQFKIVHSNLVLKRKQSVCMSIYRVMRPALIKYGSQGSSC